MSTDSVAENAKFAQAQELSYPLLCDAEREVCLKYGAVDSREDPRASRITYVIDGEGRIVQALAKVNARSHPEELLATV